MFLIETLLRVRMRARAGSRLSTRAHVRISGGTGKQGRV